MKTIDTDTLKALQAGKSGDVHVINVLPEDAFREEHIPGSVNIPVTSDDFVDRVEDLLGGKDKPVVLYCANTECNASPSAARRLEQAGFTEVYDYEVGVEGWKEAGEPVESGAAGARR